MPLYIELVTPIKSFTEHIHYKLFFEELNVQIVMTLKGYANLQ